MNATLTEIEATICEIADLMAAFDKGAADIFRNKPFHRRAIAAAFLKGCKPGSSVEKIGKAAVNGAKLYAKATALAAE